MSFQNTVDNVNSYVYARYSLVDSALNHSTGTTPVSKVHYSEDRVASGDGRRGLVS
jgi:hypothetical protein